MIGDRYLKLIFLKLCFVPNTETYDGRFKWLLSIEDDALINIARNVPISVDNPTTIKTLNIMKP